MIGVIFTGPPDRDACIKKIKEMKAINPSFAMMQQNLLNHYEKEQGLPLTQIVRMIKTNYPNNVVGIDYT